MISRLDNNWAKGISIVGGKFYLIDMKLDKKKVDIVSHKEYYVVS